MFVFCLKMWIQSRRIILLWMCVGDFKCCTAAGCCSWKQDVVSVLCKHCGGVGEDVVRTFLRCSCSILHLSHTCCCTQASKLIHIFRLNQWKQKSCWKLVQKLVIHARSVFAGYSINSLHHTPPHLYCFSGTCWTASWISCSVWVIWNTFKCCQFFQ